MAALPRGPIVTGYDGSDQSQDALALTRLLASLLGADVVVLSVVTLAPTEAAWAVYERIQREEEQRLAAEARAGMREVDRLEVLTQRGTSPARELHDLASRRRARMLVLGSTHRGALGRVLPGTVADRLLTGAPCPLAVAPRGYGQSDHPMRTVAVAYDGSAEAQEALSLAFELAAAANSKLKLTAVADPRIPLPVGPGAEAWAAMAASERTRGRTQMKEALDRALQSAAAGLEAASEVVEGDPRTTLREISERADMLLIGSRGYGPLGRVLLGGVSSAVIRTAACPVIVTPRSVVGEAPNPH
jgi:nucleotide-binding universal stress UspA family protein